MQLFFLCYVIKHLVSELLVSDLLVISLLVEKMDKLFVFGKTVSGDAFTDREKETEKLVANFKYGINTFIVSPRRWGKTSLVKKAKVLAEGPKLKIVYVDVQHCHSREEFCERFASAVLTQTAGKMDEWVENARSFLSRFSIGLNASPDPTGELSLRLNMLPKERSMEELLQLPERIAQKKGVRVVVCIDEFQQIGNYPDSLRFQAELRSVWQHHQQASYCLFGSRKHLMESLFDDTSKPFYKFGDIIYLQRIPLEYWVKYITSKFKQEGKSITRKQSEWIVNQVDGNSSYVQQLAWYVFLRTAKKVGETILREAFDELVDQCADVFEAKTEGLTAYQMNYLRAVADGVNDGLSSSQTISNYNLGSSANVAIIMKSLLEKDLIQKIDKKIFLTDPIMGHWIKRT